jgi:hypothetical protein
MKDNEETKHALRNEELRAASGTQEVRGPRFRNADNQDLWWWEKLPVRAFARRIVPTSARCTRISVHPQSKDEVRKSLPDMS